MPNHLLSQTAVPWATKSMPLGLATVLAICALVPMHGQVITDRPEQLSGRWELASASGVDGILVTISRGRTGGLMKETVQVRVYHRKDGYESGEGYAVFPPRYAAAQFDGHRLSAGGLTATFNSDPVGWTGEWVLDGEKRQVVLQRPHPAKGMPLHSLCGNWEELPDATSLLWIRIHVVQSWDGALTAWMDHGRFITEGYEDQRYGGSFKVISADPKSIILQNEASTFQTLSRFTGVLSNDGNTITGQWNGRSALRTLRRIP